MDLIIFFLQIVARTVSFFFLTDESKNSGELDFGKHYYTVMLSQVLLPVG
jgi:hypothetical protein